MNWYLSRGQDYNWWSRNMSSLIDSANTDWILSLCGNHCTRYWDYKDKWDVMPLVKGITIKTRKPRISQLKYSRGNLAMVLAIMKGLRKASWSRWWTFMVDWELFLVKGSRRAFCIVDAKWAKAQRWERWEKHGMWEILWPFEYCQSIVYEGRSSWSQEWRCAQGMYWKALLSSRQEGNPFFPSWNIQNMYPLKLSPENQISISFLAIYMVHLVNRRDILRPQPPLTLGNWSVWKKKKKQISKTLGWG